MHKVLVYGDGACSGNPGPGGWGALLYNPIKNTIAELGGGESNKTTNNRMELQALIESLKFLSKAKVKSSDVQAYWDSSYVVDGYTKWIHGWVKRDFKKADGNEISNRPMWEEVWELIRSYGKISISRVPGHMGVPANERCDEIAVGFSKGTPPELFKGKMSDYNLLDPDDFAPTSHQHKYPLYVSMVDQIVETHQSWAECEKRVKGTKGALFKKVKSAHEKDSVLEKWKSK